MPQTRVIHWSCASIHDTLQASELSLSNAANQNSSKAKPHFCSQLSIFPWNEVKHGTKCNALCAQGAGYKRSVVRAAEGTHGSYRRSQWGSSQLTATAWEPLPSAAVRTGAQASLAPAGRQAHAASASRRHHRTKGWHTRWDGGRATQRTFFLN